MTGRRHDDIQDLLAAYALDAVGDHEAAEINDHLRACPRCRSEVAAHRETAAHLVDSYVAPPTAVWDRVVANLEEAAPPPLDLSRYTPRADRRRPPAAARRAVAAAVAVVLGLGGLTIRQQRQVDDVQAVLADQALAVSAIAAFEDPGARPATLRAADGSLQVRAVVLPDGSGYLLASRLPALPRDRTYQLWGMVDGRAVSAGVLGSAPGVVAFQVSHATAALAISEEPAGGARQPTLPARLTGLVDA